MRKEKSEIISAITCIKEKSILKYFTCFNVYSGGCLKTDVPKDLQLTMTDDTELNLIMKRKTISKYMFNMAFENVYDQGYVTEKVWDALYSGNFIS